MKSTYLSRIAIVWQCFLYGIICGIGFQNQATAQNSGNAHWQHLKYAIYFTSQDIESLLADPVQFKKTMDYFAPVKPVHIYLEGSGHGEVNVRLLKTIADKFHGMGIKVSGAMVPVGERGPSTYNNLNDLEAIEKRMRSLAQVFDDVILDDWLFTTATDTKSVEERGDHSWEIGRAHV